ncbi:hypothetical protein OQ257_11410 [Actinobacillus equuli subsp. equuli]|uniref:Uncharacterized protein n=1 Tax=Actinobacillus equuli subsp. equuli TaxID=202947 RepID=A0A9X4G6J1_ACTEU|nr:hypothetical protein [Actinobacillus equuli]MDE8035763.1 hypothetical protein [Actinobacillus equuli subsp. equuli]
MKELVILIIIMFAISQNSNANQHVDINSVDDLKMAYAQNLNVYIAGESPFYFMGELTEKNLMLACRDNGYFCKNENGVISLGKREQGEQPEHVQEAMEPYTGYEQPIYEAVDKPLNYFDVNNNPDNLKNYQVVAGKIESTKDKLNFNVSFVKPVVYIYSRTEIDKKVSFFDEVLTSLAPFSLNKKLGLGMNFLLINKNVSDFFDAQSDNFTYSRTYISCVEGDYCESLTESRFEFDETIRSAVSESTSKRFDVVAQGFKIRFRRNAVDLNVSFCEDRFNCVKFNQTAERKKDMCYDLFFKTDIKINSKVIFSNSKTTKINNLGFVICEQ